MDRHGASTTVDGLLDSFHSLLIGPCTKRTIRTECKCRLVEEIATGPDGFQCTHKEWVAMFREATHAAAARGWPGEEDPTLPTTESLAGRARELLMKARIEIGRTGYFIELRKEGWIVRDEEGRTLPADDLLFWGFPGSDHPPRYHATPEEAIASYLRHEEIIRGIEERTAVLDEPDPEESGVDSA